MSVSVRACVHACMYVYTYVSVHMHTNTLVLTILVFQSLYPYFLYKHMNFAL